MLITGLINVRYIFVHAIITYPFFVFQSAELEWDQTTKSTVLASFFYGYIISQVPGGWLADRYGGKRVLGITLTASSILTLVMPVSARTSIVLVYAIRVLLGLLTVRIALLIMYKRKATIRNRYKQEPYLTWNTLRKSDKNTRKHNTQESQQASPAQAGDHKDTRIEQYCIIKMNM